MKPSDTLVSHKYECVIMKKEQSSSSLQIIFCAHAVK